MIKSKIVIPLTFVYVGIVMLIYPTFMNSRFDLKDFSYIIFEKLGEILVFSGIVYYFFIKIDTKIDGIDLRLKELNDAGIDKIKIGTKNSLRYIFDELINKNFIIDLKIISDFDTIRENSYFLKDFLKNKKYDSKVTLLISSHRDERFKVRNSSLIRELSDLKNIKTNKNLTIRITEESINFNCIIYDDNVWIIFNGKQEFENSININTRINSLLGQQTENFFESMLSRAIQIEENQ